MQFKDISVPEIYKSSSDFRFFLNWFNQCLTRLKYDTENLLDCYDPLRCKSDLLWMLADTIGYKYDDRLPVAFNRLVILYFMSMIRNKGSKDGVMLAAELNLAQFRIDMVAGTGYVDDDGNDVPPNPVLYDRLEDTSIPVNSAYVNSYVDEGYIDIVYFSSKKPVDACIEYVRPIGMYCFQHAGVRFDSRTKVSIDARLTDETDTVISIGPTHVGHYSRDDYARLQKTRTAHSIDTDDVRDTVWSRNEYGPNAELTINPGYRALYSLQLCNNSQVVKSLIDPIFGIGYGPTEVDTTYPEDYVISNTSEKPWNLRYDHTRDQKDNITTSVKTVVSTIDDTKSTDVLHPVPAVNTPMMQIGDAIVTQESEN